MLLTSFGGSPEGTIYDIYENHGFEAVESTIQVDDPSQRTASFGTGSTANLERTTQSPVTIIGMELNPASDEVDSVVHLMRAQGELFVPSRW